MNQGTHCKSIVMAGDWRQGKSPWAGSGCMSHMTHDSEATGGMRDSEHTVWGDCACGSFGPEQANMQGGKVAAVAWGGWPRWQGSES